MICALASSHGLPRARARSSAVAAVCAVAGSPSSRWTSASSAVAQASACAAPQACSSTRVRSRVRAASRSPQAASATPTSRLIQGSTKLPPCSSVWSWIASSSERATCARPATRSSSARWLRAARSAVGSPASAATATARRSSAAASACSPSGWRRAPCSNQNQASVSRSPSRSSRTRSASNPSTQAASSCRNQAAPRSSASARAAMYSSSATRQRSSSGTEAAGSVKKRWLASTSSAHASPLAAASAASVFRACEVAAAADDPRPGGERPRPQRACRRRGGEGTLERGVGLAETRPRAEPEVERQAQPQRLCRVRLQRVLDRGGEVRGVLVERGEGLGLTRRQDVLPRALGQFQEQVAVAVPRVGLESFERVLAHDLEDPEALVLDADERMLDERLQRGQRAQLERVLERRPAAEDRQRRQRAPGLVVEQPVAPVQRRPQRSPARQQVQRVVEPARDRRRREHRDPRGGQLERQRHALELAADLRHRALVVAAPGPADASRAIVEQLRGRRRRQRRDLPARLTDEPERDAAGGEHGQPRAAFQQRRDDPRGLLHDVLAVVEHEQRPLVM